jgi:hypothetical protein
MVRGLRKARQHVSPHTGQLAREQAVETNACRIRCYRCRWRYAASEGRRKTPPDQAPPARRRLSRTLASLRTRSFSAHRTLVLAKKVTVLAKKRDRYGRLVGSVMIDGKSLAARLIGAGACWHYKRYSKSRKLADLQARAKRDKLGLWARKEAIPPWRYRAMRRAKKSALSPSGSDDRTLRFVGNLRSRVFHQRGCNAFHCRNCRAFFATPGDALRAGFRPHKTCVEGTRSPLRRR